MKLSEIIKLYRKENKISMREFAKRSGVSNAYVSLIENEETKSPTLETISKLANGMHMQSNDLIDMMNDDDEIKVKSKETFNHYKNIATVPVYSKITAKKAANAHADWLEDIQVPNKISRKHDIFGLKVNSNTVDKTIPIGAIVVLQKCKEIKQGEIAAVIVNDKDAELYRFYKLRDGCLLEPDSYDERNIPIIIKESSDTNVEIIGKVIWYCMDIDE